MNTPRAKFKERKKIKKKKKKKKKKGKKKEKKARKQQIGAKRGRACVLFADINLQRNIFAKAFLCLIVAFIVMANIVFSDKSTETLLTTSPH